MSVKSLNINNTFRNDNYNTTLGYSLTEDIVKVTRLTESKISEMLDNNDTENKRFIMYEGKHQNDTLNKRMFQKKLPITYYTESTVPYSTLVGLQGNPKGEVVYNIQPRFPNSTVRNIDVASSLCRTVVNVPIVYPDISPKKLLFSLYDLRYILNRVDLDFVALNKEEVAINNRKDYYELKDDGLYHLKSNVRMGYYEYLHEYLARWVIHLNLVCEMKDYKLELDGMKHK